MVRQLLIRLYGGELTEETRVQWIVYEPGQGSGSVSQGTLREAAPYTLGARVSLLVPGEQVLLTSVQVPNMNRQRLIKAIPFALEEQLLGDPEEQHYALGKQEGDGDMPVAVAALSTMSKWHQTLVAAGIQGHYMSADCLALPWQNGSWSVLLEGDRVLVRTGPQSGLVCDKDNLLVILRLALKEAQNQEQGPERMVVFHAPAEDSASLADLCKELDLQLQDEPFEGSVLGLMASALETLPAINLLQGDFSRRVRLDKFWQPWRATAAILAGLLILRFSANIVDYFVLSQRSDNLQAQIEQVYKTALPTAKGVPSRNRVQQRLNQLKGGESTQGFLALLAECGDVLRAADGLYIRSTRFKEGQLDFDLDVRDLQTLDKLKQDLIKRTGAAVEIQTASTRGDRVETRLQIRSKGT